VALLKTTVPSTVSEAIKAADHVLIFSGNLGYYGGTASMMQLEKIRLIKKINPKVEIGWDGGINAGNAFTLAQGGVDVLNVGGAINTAEDPAGVYAKLVEEINKQGAF
jgi:ribulose-phosphate 3-epimerase